MAQAYRESVDVYFGVAMRTERSGGKSAIACVQALWADVDSSEATLALATFAIPPSCVVSSGSPGSYHAYWFLQEPLEVAEAEKLLRLLAARLGSDPAVTDASRVLRPLSVASAPDRAFRPLVLLRTHRQPEIEARS